MASDFQEIAAQQLAKKLRLEKTFKPELAKLFREISLEAKRRYASGNSLPDAALWQEDIQDLLGRHYIRSGNAFKGLVLPPGADTVGLRSAAIQAAFILFAGPESLKSSRIITQTNADDLDQAFRAASNQLQEALPSWRVSREMVANLGQRKFIDLARPRIDTIAMTETQKAAETRKAIEARVYAGRGADDALPPQPEPNEPQDMRPPRVMKRWIALPGAREAHITANDQVVEENEDFLVGGERLPYPGMGGSIANIINCRCNAHYFVEGSE